MGEERGTGTVAQRGLRVSRGKACGVSRAFRIARLNRGRTRATKECGGTGAVGQRRQGCEYGHCASSRQRGSVHLELDRQWGRWGRIGTATCSVRFQRGARGAREGDCGDGFSSRNHPRLAVRIVLYLRSPQTLRDEICGVLGSCPLIPHSCAPMHHKESYIYAAASSLAAVVAFNSTLPSWFGFIYTAAQIPCGPVAVATKQAADDKTPNKMTIYHHRQQGVQGGAREGDRRGEVCRLPPPSVDDRRAGGQRGGWRYVWRHRFGRVL
eukprot:scaffold2751_cov75-Phaeocystis_antarctica.AAC.1